MNIDFSQNYVINAETGEILELPDRVSALSELMKEFEAKKALFEMENAEMIRKIDGLKENIKADILEAKSSVSFFGLNVVYSKGKTTWDAKALNSYAKEHPELEQFRKIGSPVVAFSLKKDSMIEKDGAA